MYIQHYELETAITAYALDHIARDPEVIDAAILAAQQEMTAYLAARYDVQTIFAAEGNDRNTLLVEHCKSIAIYYLLRRSNAEVLFDKAQIYYDNAITFLKGLAGFDGRSLNIGLPLRTDTEGQPVADIKMTSQPKFNSFFE